MSAQASLKKPCRVSFTVVQVALALAFVLALGAPSLVYPFGRDQGEHAYIATAALDGQVIYRDLFHVKPPLTHIVHMLALLLFGRSMLAIRILDLLWQGATALVILLIARRVYRQKGLSVLAAALYALLYYLFDFWNTAQTDGFLNLPAALAVLAFLYAQEHESPCAYLACGAALGVAVLFKYPIGLLLPLLMLLATPGQGRWHLSRPVLLALGFCMPLALCAAALARQGALESFVLSQMGYIRQYTFGRALGGGYLVSVIIVTLIPSWPNLFLWASAVTLALQVVQAVRRGAPSNHLPIALWWLVAAGSYVAQNKGYMYHALPLLAPMSLIVAPAIARGFDRSSAPKALRYASIGAAEVCVVLAVAGWLWRGYPAVPGRALVDVLAGRRALVAVYQDPGISGSAEPGFSLPAQIQAASHIRQRSAPGDAIFIWGFEPTIYFLSQRRCASRFIYNFPLYGDWSWPDLRDDLLADLTATPPLYIIVASGDALPLVTGTLADSATALQEFGELSQLVQSEYSIEHTIEGLALYRRR